MIISHKYKFVFLKAAKAAGTSVEAALYPLLGPDDVVSTHKKSAGWKDEESYDIRRMNCGEDVKEHSGREAVLRVAGLEVWQTYFKFAVVRNPWDMVVSNYWWSKALYPKLVDTFKVFVMFMPLVDNRWLYFGDDCQPTLDYYIRFERLQEGFDEVCDKVGMPRTRLPMTMGKTRSDKRHYSSYYDRDTIQRVASQYAHEIRHFRYSFEEQQVPGMSGYFIRRP